jgi:hypothetical protein
MIGMIGMIVVIGKNPFCAEEQTISGSIGAIGGCIGAIGAVCAFSLHTSLHMCRQTKSIMCMHICTNAQNVFADRAKQSNQGLSDRWRWKGLDLVESLRSRPSSRSQIRTERTWAGIIAFSLMAFSLIIAFSLIRGQSDAEATEPVIQHGRRCYTGRMILTHTAMRQN